MITCGRGGVVGSEVLSENGHGPARAEGSDTRGDGRDARTWKHFHMRDFREVDRVLAPPERGPPRVAQPDRQRDDAVESGRDREVERSRGRDPRPGLITFRRRQQPRGVRRGLDSKDRVLPALVRRPDLVEGLGVEG